MTITARHNAIRTRMETEWNDATPVQYPNKKFTAPEDAPYVRMTITDAGARWAGMGDPGNNPARNVGQVTLQIFVLAGEGEGDATELADSALAVFRSWNDAATGLRFEVPPYALQVGEDGKWYQINVVAPYRFDNFQ